MDRKSLFQALRDSLQSLGRSSGDNAQGGNADDSDPFHVVEVTFVNGEPVIDTESLMKGMKGIPRGEQEMMAAFLRDMIGRDFQHSGTHDDRLHSELWSGENLDDIADIGSKLVDKYPNARFYSIGNSPSYLVYGIDCLLDKKGEKGKVDYIPFSERFVAKKWSPVSNDLVYALDKNSRNYKAAQRNMDAYRNLLASKGMDPRQIMDNFSRHGQRTVIIDNMQSGTSYASFIYLLYSWAADIGISDKFFSRALKSVALTDRKLPSGFKLVPLDVTVPVDTILIKSRLRLALNSNISQDGDRFIPNYPPPEWNQPPADLERITGAVVKGIKSKIAAVVHGKNPAPTVAVTPKRKGNEPGMA